MNTDVCGFRFQISNFRLNHLRTILFVGLVLIFSPFNSLSQTPSPSPTPLPTAQNFHQWGAVTLFNGLPSDNVRAIAQTPDGVLWFGTDGGLARFDGRRVERIALDGLESAKILTLETNVAGELWIGTDAGATRFFGGKFHTIPETFGKAITAIVAGEITRLVSSDAVFSTHYNPDGTLAVKTSAAADLQFVAADRTREGMLIFGSRGRGLIVETGDGFQEMLTRPRPFFVNAIETDASGDLWIGAQAEKGASGLFYAKDIFRPVRVGAGAETVLTLTAAENGDVWVGTEKRGLFRFRDAEQIEHFTFENTSGGLRSNRIYAALVDREGVLWLGTNRGACRFDASSPFNQTVSDDANANFVRTIYRTGGGQIYAGTNRGLYFFADGAWRVAENFPAKPIYAVGESANGEILIGTSSGLFTLDGKQKMPGDVRAVAQFQNKTYAAVFGRGIVQIENNIAVFTNDAPTTLYTDNQKLWIGTVKDGVFAFDGRETRGENAFNGLRGAAIRKITKDASGVFWISGERGLFRLENETLKPIIENQDVRDVAVNGADVWAATLKNGLFHLRPDENFGWLASGINVEQGLPSEQIFSVLPLENRLLVGTNRGVVIYAPSATPPQIVATRVLSQKLHSAEELREKINLDFPQNSLLVEVAGLSSRTFPEQFQYEFFLKNERGEILEKRLSSEAQFAAANLKAGDYRIEARSFNKDLLASDALTIEFSVARAPFPWTATALGALLFVAVVALVWAIIESRRIRERNRELARARFDLANEAERTRKRIAQDLHDQTLADLRNLMLMSDKLPSDNSEFRQEIESVSTEIRRICEDLSPSVLENVGLAPALEFLLSHTSPNYKFVAAENLEEKLNFSPPVEMQIYRIAQEVLNNIKRHSDARTVEMKIEVSPEDEFVLSIEDDGTFFDPAEIASKGRGIVNIKSRVSLIKAEAVWEKTDGGNTRFSLRKK